MLRMIYLMMSIAHISGFYTVFSSLLVPMFQRDTLPPSARILNFVQVDALKQLRSAELDTI